ncbi:MAG: hypothetical protein C4521_12390 [Actinobacteria bacterium]|nr:MAG: hypothetical protein C4521_12390 [Actinomycetota bacterium]
MVGGKQPKRKGDDGEREFIKLMGGERTYWQPKGKPKTDVVKVPGLGAGETKRERDGWKRLYKWLTDNDFVAVRADRKPWLVVMKLSKVQELLAH